ncbi:Chromosome segregation ATPase [Giardia duodenalis assemblage B]|uniref:Chromosome segregation ATPase n=1 Tax=Giardia duodenalis assemblage B TaxID=1394984 RepID=A0A132NX28_GIAIN|nr:Chromosome segregation ATPase [Giardia intestinalis assemblage B]
MQKVKRPQYIARKEHARYLNELERQVVSKGMEVDKMRKDIELQEKRLAITPDFAITFVEKQAQLTKYHADLDLINKRLDEELKKLRDTPIEDRATAAQETYAQHLADLDEKLRRPGSSRPLWRLTRKILMRKNYFWTLKRVTLKPLKLTTAKSAVKIEASKQILAGLRPKLEAERSSVEAKLHTQKRESEKIARTLERRNTYMKGVQRHLKENSIAIMTEQVKRLLEDFRTHTPEFMAARTEFVYTRRKYLEASGTPLIVYDPPPRVIIGEGELWEKIDAEARELEAKLETEIADKEVGDAKDHVSENDSSAVNAQIDCCPADSEFEARQIEEHVADEPLPLVEEEQKSNCAPDDQ